MAGVRVGGSAGGCTRGWVVLWTSVCPRWMAEVKTEQWERVAGRVVLRSGSEVPGAGMQMPGALLWWQLGVLGLFGRANLAEHRKLSLVQHRESGGEVRHVFGA